MHKIKVTTLTTQETMNRLCVHTYQLTCFLPTPTPLEKPIKNIYLHKLYHLDKINISVDEIAYEFILGKTLNIRDRLKERKKPTLTQIHATDLKNLPYASHLVGAIACNYIFTIDKQIEVLRNHHIAFLDSEIAILFRSGSIFSLLMNRFSEALQQTIETLGNSNDEMHHSVNSLIATTPELLKKQLPAEKKAAPILHAYDACIRISIKYMETFIKHIASSKKEEAAEDLNVTLLLLATVHTHLGDIHLKNTPEDILSYLYDYGKAQDILKQIDDGTRRELFSKYDFKHRWLIPDECRILHICLKNNYGENLAYLSDLLIKDFASISMNDFVAIHEQIKNLDANLFKELAKHYYKLNDFDRATNWCSLVARFAADEDTKNIYTTLIKAIAVKKSTVTSDIANHMPKEKSTLNTQQEENIAEFNHCHIETGTESNKKIDNSIFKVNSTYEKSVDTVIKKKAEVNIDTSSSSEEKETTDENKQVAKAYPQSSRKIKIYGQKKKIEGPPRLANSLLKEINRVNPNTLFGEQFSHRQIFPFRTRSLTGNNIIFYGYFDCKNAINLKINKTILENHQHVLRNPTDVVFSGPGLRMFQVLGTNKRMRPAFKTVINGKKEIGGDFRMWGRTMVAEAKDKEDHQIFLYALDEPHDHNSQKVLLKKIRKK